MRAAAILARTLIFCISAPLAPTSGHAETVGHVLHGLKSVQVVGENLDEYSQRCGLLIDDLRSVAVREIAASSLTTSNNANSPISYINVQSLGFPNGLCVSNVELSLLAFQPTNLAFSGKIMPIKVVLWEDGRMVSGIGEGYSQKISQVIDRQVKHLLADWLEDSQ